MESKSIIKMTEKNCIEDYFTEEFAEFYESLANKWSEKLLDWAILHNQDLTYSMLELLLQNSYVRDVDQRRREFTTSLIVKRDLIEVTPEIVTNMTSKFKTLDGTLLVDTIYHFCKTHKIFDIRIDPDPKTIREFHTGVNHNASHESMFSKIVNTNKPVTLSNAFDL